ncbi:hypothetical protein BDR07DRAFT_1385236 [Suillus spraguei]|nr:hypothetical protein BDR07DRAFT_1385236 [Suillus spraguei]
MHKIDVLMFIVHRDPATFGGVSGDQDTIDLDGLAFGVFLDESVTSTSKMPTSAGNTVPRLIPRSAEINALYPLPPPWALQGTVKRTQRSHHTSVPYPLPEPKVIPLSATTIPAPQTLQLMTSADFPVTPTTIAPIALAAPVVPVAPIIPVAPIAISIEPALQQLVEPLTGTWTFIFTNLVKLVWTCVPFGFDIYPPVDSNILPDDFRMRVLHALINDDSHLLGVSQSWTEFLTTPSYFECSNGLSEFISDLLEDFNYVFAVIGAVTKLILFEQLLRPPVIIVHMQLDASDMFNVILEHICCFPDAQKATFNNYKSHTFRIGNSQQPSTNRRYIPGPIQRDTQKYAVKCLVAINHFRLADSMPSDTTGMSGRSNELYYRYLTHKEKGDGECWQCLPIPQQRVKKACNLPASKGVSCSAGPQASKHKESNKGSTVIAKHRPPQKKVAAQKETEQQQTSAQIYQDAPSMIYDAFLADEPDISDYRPNGYSEVDTDLEAAETDDDLEDPSPS